MKWNVGGDDVMWCGVFWCGGVVVVEVVCCGVKQWGVSCNMLWYGWSSGMVMWYRRFGVG